MKVEITGPDFFVLRPENELEKMAINSWLSRPVPGIRITINGKPKIDWQDFFKEHGGSSLQYLYYFERGPDSVTVEKLYQAIEARLISKFQENIESYGWMLPKRKEK